jgi:hypothetical protein
MGTEFIRSTKDKHRKAWKAEAQQGTSDLFASADAAVARSFRAKLEPGNAADPDVHVQVRLSDREVLVIVGAEVVAKAIRPKDWLLKKLNESHGIDSGVVEESDQESAVIVVRLES